MIVDPRADELLRDIVVAVDAKAFERPHARHIAFHFDLRKAAVHQRLDRHSAFARLRLGTGHVHRRLAVPNVPTSLVRCSCILPGVAARMQACMSSIVQPGGSLRSARAATAGAFASFGSIRDCERTNHGQSHGRDTNDRQQVLHAHDNLQRKKSVHRCTRAGRTEVHFRNRRVFGTCARCR